MGERNVDAPNFFDRFEAEFGDERDTGKVDYDLENLNSLGVTQWELEDMRKDALKYYPKTRDAISSYWTKQQEQVPVDQRKPIPKLSEAQFYAMIRENLKNQGKAKGAAVWDAIYRSKLTRDGRHQRAAEKQDMKNLPAMERIAYSAIDTAMSFGDARVWGVLEPVTELVAEAGKKIVGDTGLVFAGGDTAANKAFAGRSGYRKARNQIRKGIEDVIKPDLLGIDLDLGAMTRDVAHLYGFMGGAGGIGRSATGRLAKLSVEAAKKSKISKAALMLITGTTPRAAAKALQAQRILSKGIVKGGEFIPRVAGGALRDKATKTVTGTFLGSIPKNAANFGAYEGITAFNQAVGLGANIAFETGNPVAAWEAYGEAMKRVPVAWLNGATTGALFPFFQKLGHGLAVATKGSLIGMGATSKNLLSGRFKAAFGKPLMDQLARAKTAGMGSQIVAGAAEFGAFPLAPHWDENFKPHMDTFEALLSDDPEQRALGLKAVLSSMLMSVVVKGRQAYAMRNGKPVPDPVPGEIDWYATWRDGMTKIHRYADKDARPRDKTPEQQAVEDAQLQWLARSGLDLPAATDNVALDIIRMMGDAVDRLQGDPELAERLVFDTMKVMMRDARVKSEIIKALKQAGGRHASPELLPSYVLGEFRRRMIDKADATRDKEDANEKLLDALDRLQDAKGDLHPDWAAANPEVQRINGEIEQLEAALRNAEGRLNPEQDAAIREQLEGLTRGLQQMEAAGVEAYEVAKQDFIEAAYERVVELIAERKDAEKKKADKAKKNAELLGVELTGKEADVEGTTDDALGRPKKGDKANRENIEEFRKELEFIFNEADPEEILSALNEARDALMEKGAERGSPEDLWVEFLDRAHKKGMLEDFIESLREGEIETPFDADFWEQVMIVGDGLARPVVDKDGRTMIGYEFRPGTDQEIRVAFNAETGELSPEQIQAFGEAMLKVIDAEGRDIMKRALEGYEADGEGEGPAPEGAKPKPKPGSGGGGSKPGSGGGGGGSKPAPKAPDAEAKKRAEAEDKSKEILDNERAKTPETSSALAVAEGLRQRAASMDGNNGRWPLRAAEILEKLGDQRVREILHESGAAGLKREGISEKLSREIRDIIGVPLKKPTAPGQTPGKAAGKEAPGKKTAEQQVIETLAAAIAKRGGPEMDTDPNTGNLPKYLKAYNEGGESALIDLLKSHDWNKLNQDRIVDSFKEVFGSKSLSDLAREAIGEAKDGVPGEKDENYEPVEGVELVDKAPGKTGYIQVPVTHLREGLDTQVRQIAEALLKDENNFRLGKRIVELLDQGVPASRAVQLALADRPTALGFQINSPDKKRWLKVPREGGDVLPEGVWFHGTDQTYAGEEFAEGYVSRSLGEAATYGKRIFVFADKDVEEVSAGPESVDYGNGYGGTKLGALPIGEIIDGKYVAFKRGKGEKGGAPEPFETVTVYHAGKLEGETITGAEGQLHVGSLAAAQYIQERTGSRAPHIFSTELTLDPRRILRMIDSVKGHGAGEVAEDVKAWFAETGTEMPPKLGELLDQVIHLYTREAKADNAEGMTAAARRLVAGLKKLGYDAIAYENLNEDAGHTSYIILDPDLTKFRNVMEPPPEAKDNVVKAGKAHAIIEGLVAKWKYGIPEKTNLDQIIGHIDTALEAAGEALDKLPNGMLRARVASQEAELQGRKRWFQYEASERRQAEASEAQAEVPEIVDGKSTARVVTPSGIDERLEGANAVERFRERSGNELLEKLMDAADEIGEGVRENLPLIQAGLELGREFQQDPANDRLLPLSAEGGLTYGDRVVVTTGDGRVISGIVITEPRDTGAEATGFIGRRLKLWDGEQTHSVRIADVTNVTPENIRALNTDVGLSDGVFRNGAEVTPSMLLQIIRPEPIHFPEHVTSAPSRKQRRRILRGEGTEQDQREQAELRQRRLRLLDGSETLHPDDWMAMAQQMLVPRDQRKTAFGSPSAGGKLAKLAKALRDVAAGKAISKEAQDLIDGINRTEYDTLTWMGEYHDPATAKLRTPKQLEAEAAKDPKAREDWNLYLKYEAKANEADKILKGSLSSRKVRDAGMFLTLIGSKAGNAEHLLEWRAYNTATKRMDRAPGKPPHVFATYRPETGTWLLRTAERGSAIEWVRDNLDSTAQNMKRYAQQQRKLARTLDNESVVVAVMDRQRQLAETARGALDVLMNWAHEGTLHSRLGGAVRGRDEAGEVRDNKSKEQARELLEEILGDYANEINQFIEKNPMPEGEGKDFTKWAKRFQDWLTKGAGSIYGRMLMRIDEGKHPLTGREAVYDESTGMWVSAKPKGESGGTKFYSGLPIIPSKEGIRDLVGLMRRPGKNVQAIYGMVHGMTADFTGSLLQTTVVTPLHKLSRAILGINGGPDKADTAFGWSPRATRAAMVHNRHLANMDLITRDADVYIKGLVKKYGSKKLLELVQAEHEGKQPWQLREFRKLMQDIADEMKSLGMVGEEFDARYDGRYVRLGRYTWKDSARLKESMIAARKRSKEIGEQIEEYRTALNALEGPPTEGQMQRLKELSSESAAQEARSRSLRAQWIRSRRSLFRNWKAYNQVHSSPIDVADVRALRKWEGADRRRENDDWQWHVDAGLDTSRPELLLWDSIIHHRHAIETYRFMKQIAQDPDLSKSIQKAPKDWVRIDHEDVKSNLAFRELAGKKVDPWIYHFLKLSEGPNGVAERIANDVHSAIKMSLTFASPANWALQIIANPLMVGVKGGVSIWRAYPEYLKALTELFIPGRADALRKKYGPMRFLDVATDADREFMHNLHSENPDINTRTIMDSIARTANNFREGKVGAGIRTAGKTIGHPFNKWLQLQSMIYRSFDAAGRIATYRILRKQGKTRGEAEAAVVQGWDLFHQNKWGDFLRKGVVQIPGTKIKIPLPIMANSFGSVPVTFLRNFAQVAGKTPLQMAELAVTIALYNQAVQQANGMTDDEVETLQRNVTPNDNSILAWLRSKTTPISPSGTQAYDLWNYHPVTAATEAVPGMSQAMWGGIEGFSDEGLKGVIPGMFRGKGGYGLTAEQDFVSKALGAGHVMMAPYSELLLDRDAKGNAVRWRNERPALWGSQGALKVAVEEGHAPIAVIMALGYMGGMNPSFRAGLAAVASSVTQIAAELDKTADGENPVFEVISDGESLFEVRPRSAEDALLRRAGLRLRNPDALRRLVERVERQKGIHKDPRHGNYTVDDDVPPALRERLARMAQFGNTAKRIKSGAYLWGMARHWMETKWPEYAERLKDYDEGEKLPDDFWDGDQIRAAIAARWKNAESRATAAQALVTLDMGQEAGDTLQILARMRLLDPEVGAKIPPLSPDEFQKVFRGRK